MTARLCADNSSNIALGSEKSSTFLGVSNSVSDFNGRVRMEFYKILIENFSLIHVNFGKCTS